MKKLAVLLILSCCGCTHLALERHALNQVGTVSDLRYRAVMNNLAVNAHEPSSIPFYSLLSGGATAVTDNGQIGLGTVWNAIGFENGEAGVQGSRDISENWTLDPIFEPEKLKAMRAAYQWVLYGPESLSPEAIKELTDFDVINQLCKLPAGWLQRGCKGDVPRHACFSACWKDTWVWIEPGNMDSLSRFTLVILDIATNDLSFLDPDTVEIEECFDMKDGKPKLVSRKVIRTASAQDYEKELTEGAPSKTPARSSKPRVRYNNSDARLRSTLNLQNKR